MTVQAAFRLSSNVRGAVSTGEVCSLSHSLVHSFTHLVNVGDNDDGDGQHVLETRLKALPIFLLNLHKHPGCGT